MKLYELDESLRTENPCWKGYYPVGTKKKNGRTVPNCVPKPKKKVKENVNVVNLEFVDGTKSALRARTNDPVRTVINYLIRRRDIDKLKNLKKVDNIDVTNIIQKLFNR